MINFLAFMIQVLTKYKRDKGAGQEESEEGQALLSQGEIESA